MVLKDVIKTTPENLSIKDNVAKIDATGIYYRDLNRLLRSLDGNGIEKIEIRNVYGQRYIGTDLDDHLSIDIYGTPGNDLGAFMNGPKDYCSRKRAGRMRKHHGSWKHCCSWTRR